MVKVVLHDDPMALRRRAGISESWLAGDCPVVDPVQVNPTLTVRRRWRTGYDEDGNPEFDWADVVTGVAILWEERTELDDVAGVTHIVARTVILYDGDEEVVETSIVESSHGGLFRVLSVAQTPDRIEMKLERLEDSNGG